MEEKHPPGALGADQAQTKRRSTAHEAQTKRRPSADQAQTKRTSSANAKEVQSKHGQLIACKMTKPVFGQTTASLRSTCPSLLSH